jgi:uncharacterized protein YpmS
MPDRYYIGGQPPRRPRSPSGASRRPSVPNPPAGKWRRIAGRIVLVVAVLGILGGLLLYRAVKHVPAFYQQAMEVSLQEHMVASDKMVRDVAGLVSDVNKTGRWQAVFTAAEINGWLAVELAKKRPELLPPSLSDPRVSITKEGVSVACRFRSPALDSVASLTVDVYRPELDPADPLNGRVVALQVRKVRAGNLPLPLGKILEEVSKATGQLDWEVRWRQAGGEPVALVTIPPPRGRGDKLVLIDTIELAEGEIRVAGTSRRP